MKGAKNNVLPNNHIIFVEFDGKTMPDTEKKYVMASEFRGFLEGSNDFSKTKDWMEDYIERFGLKQGEDYFIDPSETRFTDYFISEYTKTCIESEYCYMAPPEEADFEPIREN